MVSWFRKLLGQPAADAPTVCTPPSASEALASFRDMIVRDVNAGFDTPADILQAATDCFDGEIDAQVLRERGPVFLAEALAAHEAAQARWSGTTDCERLDAAFAALERRGVVARQNFSCCGTCGSSEIWDEIEDAERGGNPVHGYAFYHMQDTERGAEGEGIYLNYGASEDGEGAALAVGQEIIAELEAHGLQTDWDGSWDQRIHVALDWKRRRPVAQPWTSGPLH